MNNTAKLAKIGEVQKQIPSFKCKDGCADCCGPVLATRLEWKRIYERIGRTEEQLRKEISERLNKNDFRCVLLGPDNKCTVYDIRPTICRLFGASESKTPNACLVCPHGVGPEKFLNEQETTDILVKIERLGF